MCRREPRTALPVSSELNSGPTHVRVPELEQPDLFMWSFSLPDCFRRQTILCSEIHPNFGLCPATEHLKQSSDRGVVWFGGRIKSVKFRGTCYGCVVTAKPNLPPDVQEQVILRG
ncbi:hypothetical protein A0H81_06770 [Grifola frondosa]|uniref:Uncharacterized protein n=1 Tax=Grifola frondosa TaxID=5627 RepID=A0A1C7M7Q4_GRIFR|nr:hypothetical protein A0H81_06770 [Grifola frondosa]